MDLLDSPTGIAEPPRCRLCDGLATVSPAGFRQFYPQAGAAPIPLTWWACVRCRGWFAYPIPSAGAIARHWGAVTYNDTAHANEIALHKREMTHRILDELAARVTSGHLLDIGCNFGHFMAAARSAGWSPMGFEPNERAAKLARAQGFEVRCGWDLDAMGFPDEKFAAVSVIDVFALAWHPIAMLRTAHRLLHRGGVLGMRISNKRTFLGLVRAVSPPGRGRDRLLSRLLQNQFHMIGLRELTAILQSTGFAEVHIEPGPPLSPQITTRTAYLAARFIRNLSNGWIDITPGVLLFARKR